MTGLSIETEQGSTAVEVRAHRANLTTTDPGAEIAHRLRLRFDGAGFTPADISVKSDSQPQMIYWRGISG